MILVTFSMMGDRHIGDTLAIALMLPKIYSRRRDFPSRRTPQRDLPRLLIATFAIQDIAS